MGRVEALRNVSLQIPRCVPEASKQKAPTYFQWFDNGTYVILEFPSTLAEIWIAQTVYCMQTDLGVSYSWPIWKAGEDL